MEVATPPPPLKFQIKESNKTKQKIEENPLENDKEGKHVCLVFMCSCVNTCINKHFISKFSPSILL